jgi:Uma2 family endonuclease
MRWARTGRVNYDDGVMEIMTISAEHDGAKSRIGGLIEDLAIELGMEAAPRIHDVPSKRLRKGLEPDECYYIANEAKVRGKKQLDLRRDPAPDLVVEMTSATAMSTAKASMPRWRARVVALSTASG